MVRSNSFVVTNIDRPGKDRDRYGNGCSSQDDAHRLEIDAPRCGFGAWLPRRGHGVTAGGVPQQKSPHGR